MRKRDVENVVTENSFTIDSMGRIVIVDSDELLEAVSGGMGIKETNLETKSSLLIDPMMDELSLLDTLSNNCNCGSGSGSGNSGSGGPCSGPNVSLC